MVGGRATHAFNLLPLRYGWAYELYRRMKANHWEPEDVPMQRDIEQWRSHEELSDVERWIVRMGIGYFSAAEGIVGDNIIHVVRELVTASELKLVLGRHAHEENIHADSLLYMISSLGIDPHECEAMFEDVPTIARKNEFVTASRAICAAISTCAPPSISGCSRRNIFVFGQCMEGTQFYGLFGMILSLYRQGKLTGVGTMFRYTLRDESNHIEVFRRLLLELVAENPGIWTPALRAGAARAHARSGRARARVHPRLPAGARRRPLGRRSSRATSTSSRTAASSASASSRCSPGAENPLPWLAELMDVRKEQNFFEGRVTEYQRVLARRRRQTMSSDPTSTPPRELPWRPQCPCSSTRSCSTSSSSAPRRSSMPAHRHASQADELGLAPGPVALAGEVVDAMPLVAEMAREGARRPADGEGRAGGRSRHRSSRSSRGASPSGSGDRGELPLELTTYDLSVLVEAALIDLCELALAKALVLCRTVSAIRPGRASSRRS